MQKWPVLDATDNESTCPRTVFKNLRKIFSQPGLFMNFVTKTQERPWLQPERRGDRLRGTSSPKGAEGINAGTALKG